MVAFNIFVSGFLLDTLKELQEFLTKTEISVTSDNGFTMEVYGDFRFWIVQLPMVTFKI